jgi:hypothetical protein
MARTQPSRHPGEDRFAPFEESILTQPSSALITEGEKVTYCGRLHFMMGVEWLVLALLCLAIGACLAFGTLFVPFHYAAPVQPSTIMHALAFVAAFVGFCFLIWYLLPFWRSFLVITNRRALVGVGHFVSVQEQILPYQLEDWEIRQNFFESLLGYGHVTLRLIEGRQLRIIYLAYVAHPHQFMHHLEELCPPDIRSSATASAQRSPPPPPETVSTNSESAPPGGSPPA